MRLSVDFKRASESEKAGLNDSSADVVHAHQLF